MNPMLLFLSLVASLATVLSANPTVHKYLIVTTQRSGSTWFCHALDVHEGVSCGHGNDNGNAGEGVKASELMMKYSFLKTIDDWSRWEEDADLAFSRIQQAFPNNRIFGFKIMYSQIKAENAEKFAKYAWRRGISVIHLVREAQINRLTSFKFLGGQKFHHTTNASEVKEHRNRRMKVDVADAVSFVRRAEADNIWWSSRLRLSPRVTYLYAAYEMMLDPVMFGRFLYVFFAGVTYGQERWDGKEHNSALLKIHSPRCSERVRKFKVITFMSSCMSCICLAHTYYNTTP
jgi:LPS sulfotransferase NodH